MNKIKEIIQNIIKTRDLANQFVFLYGCSIETTFLLFELDRAGIKVETVLDSDPKKEYLIWSGYKVQLPQYLESYPKDKVCVFVWSMFKDAMNELLLSMGYTNIINVDISRDSEEFLDAKLSYLDMAYSVFDEIRLKYPNDFYLVVPKPSGDIYIGLSYLRSWMQSHNITNPVCVIGQDKGVKDIAFLYDIEHWMIISEDDRRKLIFLSSIEGEKSKLKLLSPWELNIRNTFFPNCETNMVFVDKYRYEVFNLEKGAKPCYPTNLTVKEKTNCIVLAPYAYSTPAPNLSALFWEKLTVSLIDRGFIVSTLGYGENEPPIKRTDRIQFSYKEAGIVLGRCSCLISVRSGLCDIVHNIECDQIILFSNKKFPFATSFYGMKANYENYKGKEINCDNMSDQQIIDIIMESVDIL